MIDFTNKKIICSCEGTFEEDLINYLLDNDKLKFSKNQLVDEKVTRFRSASKIQTSFLNRKYDEKIIILRILDSKNEKFKLSKEYQKKVLDVYDIRTRPEIEILVIIDKSDWSKFKNRKGNLKASTFCQNEYKLSEIKNEGFVEDYFRNIEDLIKSIKKYNSLVSYKGYNLSDLLK